MSELAYVSYRPARVGFLVSRHSLAELLTAVRMNTLLWGGAWNPIIAADSETAARWIARFRVDLLHAVEPTAATEAVMAANPHLRWPMGDDELLRNRYGVDVAEPTLLDVAPAMEEFYDVRGWALERSHHYLFEWDPHDPLAALFTVRFGEFHGDIGARYRQMFTTLLRGERVQPRRVDFGERERPAPIDLTAAALRDDLIGPSRRAIVVGDPANAEHLQDYWNLRAGGYAAEFFVGDELLDRGLERMVATHRERAPTLPEWHRRIDVFDLTDGDLPDRLSEILDGLELVHHPDLNAAWDLGRPPAIAVTDSHDVLAGGDIYGDRHVLQVPLAGKPFKEAYVSLVTQLLIASVATPPRATEGTIQIPYLPRLQGRLWDVGLRIHDVRAETQRTGFLIPASTSHLTVRLLSTLEILTAVFAEAGLVVEESQSGRAARELIRQLGHLQRARVFRLRGVRALVESRAAHNGLPFSAATEMIRDGFADADRFYVSGVHLAEPRDVFRFLLERRLFLAGLQLRCPRCEHASILGARELDDEVRCAKCGETFLLAPVLRRNQWRYRLSGLLEQRPQHTFAGDPEARPPEPVAVLLTLAWLNDATGAGTLHWEPNVQVGGEGIDLELDVVALELGHHGEVAIALGECRNRGMFTDEDVERREQIAERLRPLGIDCYLIFATLRDELDPREVARFRGLRDRLRIGGHAVPRPPIILTRRDLETNWFADTQARYHGPSWSDLGRFAAAANDIYLN